MKHKVDVRRLLCPLPVIRLGEAMNLASVGDIIEIRATDKGVLHDIPAWSRVHGHEVICAEEKVDEIILTVKKIV
ncbi:MAG TPA: sulfurtransferase TusA family protein [Candidatus Thioglobus sp.]|jgi:tRNA 2-thiouridine synthesizing protein A|nr:sulfurtransferase TusA family protein [Candidatus Thioglobus sp.]HIL42442.1 sulfurtransferase TusA family protein [Gammaproteobacteria bacterium]